MKTKNSALRRKKTLKSILIILSLFLITNCQKEQELEEFDEIIPSKLTIEHISINALKKQKSFAQSFNTIDEYFDTSNKISLQTKGKQRINDFVILTDNIIQITKDSIKTITFAIENNDKKNIFYNFVIQINLKNEFRYLITKYSQKNNTSSFPYNVSYEIIDSNLINIDNFKELFDIIPYGLNDRIDDCIEISYEPCSGSGDADGHAPCEGYCNGSATILDFSDCFHGSGGGTTGGFPTGDITEPNDSSNYSSSGSSYTGGGTGITTTPINPDGSSAILLALSNTLNLSSEQFNFLSKNTDTAKKVFLFLDKNMFSTKAKNYSKSAINILLSPFINSNYLPDYKKEILRMTKHLRDWGSAEDEIFADYVENLVPNLNNMSIGEVQDIYALIRQQTYNLTYAYFGSIIIPFADAAIPFIEYVIIEATVGVAIPIIAKIPLKMVLRGVRLNRMVRSVAKLGVEGKKSQFRIVPNTTPEKAKALFNKLTQNRIGNYNYPKAGVITANMGNNSHITYRTVYGSGFEATIDLNFPLIFGKTPKVLKFIP